VPLSTCASRACNQPAQLNQQPLVKALIEQFIVIAGDKRVDQLLSTLGKTTGLLQFSIR
jgi:hypothetical protein